MPGMPGRPRGRVHERAVRMSMLEDEACRMVADGMSVREVAQAQDVAVATAHQRIARAVAKLPSGNAELWRRTADEHIDRVLEEAWKLVSDPPRVVSAGKVLDVVDAQAVNSALNTVLKALERRAKMRGIDAPTRQTVTVVDNRVLEEAISEMEARLANTVDVLPVAVSDGVDAGQGSGDGGSGAGGPVRAVEAGVGGSERG